MGVINIGGDGIITIDGKKYKLLDTNFPTIDSADPYVLSKEEAEVMDKLRNGFVKCEKLQEHVRFLYRKGSLYKTCNNNLLFHGCVPLTGDGKLKEVEICGQKYKGSRDLYQNQCAWNRNHACMRQRCMGKRRRNLSRGKEIPSRIHR